MITRRTAPNPTSSRTKYTAGLQVRSSSSHTGTTYTAGLQVRSSSSGAADTAILQTASGGQRGLSEGEIRLARSVFGDTIDYHAVTIYRKSYFPLGLQNNDVAMAPNGNIYFDPDGNLYRDDFGSADISFQALFIHEMTHIWQHQQGTNVAARGLFNRSYNYLPLKPGKAFSDYGIEQQGDIVRDYFYLKNGYNLKNRPLLDVYRKLIPFVDE